MKRHGTLIGIAVVILTVSALGDGRTGQVRDGAASPGLQQTAGGDVVDPRDLVLEDETDREDRAALVSDAFTYQGLLSDGGSPANGEYDLQFTLTDDLGVVIAGPICIDNVNCVDGLFTVSLNFGAQFGGDARELLIAVRPGGAPGNCAVGGGYSALAPRQKLTAVPYALGLRLPYSADVNVGGSALRIANSNPVGGSAAIRGVQIGVPDFGFTDLAGLRGEGAGSGTAGVLGIADTYIGVVGYAGGNIATGTFGRADGLGGIGVRGWATNSGGIGVKGVTYSADGWAGYFEGRGYFSGNVGIGVEVPAARLDVVGTTKTTAFQLPTGAAAGEVLTSDAAGNGSWQPVPVQSTPSAFTSGSGNNPTAATQFLTPFTTVTITAGQKIYVSANKAFGSTAAGGADGLDLYVGYRVAGSGAVPTVFGAGILNNRVAQNTRVTMGISAIITGIAAGTYEVGMAGDDDGNGNWNSNEYGYVSAFVLN